MTSTTKLIAAAAVAAAILPAAEAAAEDAYKVGISAAVTGRGSSTYAPVVEAMRIYFDEVNANGGVNGHPVELIVEDNQAEPSKAAATAKKLINQDEVVLLVNTSLSSTYAPMVADATRSKVPLLFAGGVCPAEVYPPADRLQFCTTAYNISMDMRFAMDFIEKESGGDAGIGMAGMAIPLVRTGLEEAQAIAKDKGMEVVATEIIPPPTADYAPFATSIKQAGATYGFSWSPWVTQIKTFEALRKINWDGPFLAYGHIEAEDELKRVQDPGFFVFGANALTQEDLPIVEEIAALAEKRGASHPVTQLTEGWVAAMVMEAALRKVEWPATREKMIAAMNGLEVDLAGLRGGPLVWTEDNHFRTNHYYRVYNWDDGIRIVRDWQKVEVK